MYRFKLFYTFVLFQTFYGMTMSSLDLIPKIKKYKELGEECTYNRQCQPWLLCTDGECNDVCWIRDFKSHLSFPLLQCFSNTRCKYNHQFHHYICQSNTTDDDCNHNQFLLFECFDTGTTGHCSGPKWLCDMFECCGYCNLRNGRCYSSMKKNSKEDLTLDFTFDKQVHDIHDVAIVYNNKASSIIINIILYFGSLITSLLVGEYFFNF